MRLFSRIDAEQRYEKLRALALEVSQNSLTGNLKLTKITTQALEATRAWENSVLRQYDWDWLNNYSYYSKSYPKRFEIAVWESSTLIAISLGRPTYHATGMRLDVVEAMPRDLGDRSNVFDTIILAYEIYARMINANHIRIMNPVNDRVRAFYERYGYQYIPKGDYLTRDIL